MEKMSLQHQLLTVIIFLGFGLFPAHAKQKLIFGVVPQQSAAKLASQWGPLIDGWAEEANLDITFATAPDIPTFEQRLAAGEYDIAYMNPYHFILFKESPGYTAIAKAKNKRIHGIVVVSQDWQQGMDKFDGRTIAFPAPRAFAATIINQSELKALGISFESKFVGSHDSVYLGVARGLYVAGGGVLRTFNSLPDNVKDQLKIIHKSKGYTPHAIAVLKDLDSTAIEKLTRAMENLDNNASVKKSFNMLNIQGLEKAQDADWDDIAELDISISGEL
ncbi:phosphate/phosphite/phosphonate ABC transporter substrate-binding protein [Vibrio sp. CAU 1672]|uniref:phosphate/phosphite/phosphonate ABC transporter substrate-binding protein n=1 Tax=Vibrio sp. CAU 1672 TaxID=3032594 RepID=UPI0023DA15F9|nr:phosphate/phosphite/phosphonate ABC transporter substrate-binding protein [Vibrio sp. CAU 1672]MDF2152868.1 phosphate/phosphite/phosphonate ABC transporter substrate-binding protein [Vibrio sp. CAU 1672]